MNVHQPAASFLPVSNLRRYVYLCLASGAQACAGHTLKGAVPTPISARGAAAAPAEGGMTNGAGMMRFSRGFLRFGRDLPIAPVVLRASVPWNLDLQTHTLTSDFLSNLFWFCWAPSIRLEARVLPPMTMRPVSPSQSGPAGLQFCVRPVGECHVLSSCLEASPQQAKSMRNVQAAPSCGAPAHHLTAPAGLRPAPATGRVAGHCAACLPCQGCPAVGVKRSHSVLHLHSSALDSLSSAALHGRCVALKKEVGQHPAK